MQKLFVKIPFIEIIVHPIICWIVGLDLVSGILLLFKLRNIIERYLEFICLDVVLVSIERAIEEEFILFLIFWEWGSHGNG